MIVVLKENKAILGVMGLLTSGDDIRTILPILLWSIPLISLLMPCIAYSLSNINDVNKATEATYVVAADVLCLGQYWFLVAQRNELKKILKRLDGLVQKRNWNEINQNLKISKWMINLQIAFQEVHRLRLNFTPKRKVKLCCSPKEWKCLSSHHHPYAYFCRSLSPQSLIYVALIRPGFGFCHTKLCKYYEALQKWQYFGCGYILWCDLCFRMPFDEGTALGYGLTMINQLVGSWVICLIICNVNSFFFGICSYIETMLTDLFCMFDVIEEHLKKYVEYPSHYFIDVQLRNIIRCHIDIMR